MFEGVGRCAGRRLGRLGGRWLTTFVVFEGVDLGAGRRLGRLGRRGCVLVDDFCGAGVGLLSVRGCGRGWWPSSRSSRVSVRRGLRGVRLRLGCVRLRSRLWVVGVTRKDV